MFIGFTEAGLPLGVTFSFLITSPLSDMAAFVVLLSIFGYKIAVAYMLLGVVLGMVGGAVIQALKMEQFVEEYVWKIKTAPGRARNDQAAAPGVQQEPGD